MAGVIDLKVGEEVRQRVFKEALATFSSPLDRSHLDEVAREFFRRLPAHDQHTVEKVWGWRDEQGSPHLDEGAVSARIAAFSDDELARCPKKHRAAHQAYLTAIRSSRPASKPAVHDRMPQASPEPAAPVVKKAA